MFRTEQKNSQLGRGVQNRREAFITGWRCSQQDRRVYNVRDVCSRREVFVLQLLEGLFIILNVEDDKVPE